jgi:hypothetical protein
MKLVSLPILIIVGSTCMLTGGCSSTANSTAKWRVEAQSSYLLPVGLEYSNTVSNNCARIDGRSISHRFVGIEFFEECFSTMSGRERIWYALIYRAQHRLDGEYGMRFRLATIKQAPAILKLAKTLSASDWSLIGQALGVHGAVARERVMRTFDRAGNE